MIQAKIVFWDFDGVIKESVSVKTEAFIKLFEPFGADVVARVRSHLLANGGTSRFEKIPTYLKWAGQPVTDDNINNYCRAFSHAVLNGVVAAPWVPGVERYLRENRHGQQFVLVTATPLQEIKTILTAIGLNQCFTQTFGSPTRKEDAIRQVLSIHGISALECLMVGDATVDLEAAHRNKVPFLLRRHLENQHVFLDYDGAFVENFSGL